MFRFGTLANHVEVIVISKLNGHLFLSLTQISIKMKVFRQIVSGAATPYHATHTSPFFDTFVFRIQF